MKELLIIQLDKEKELKIASNNPLYVIILMQTRIRLLLEIKNV